MINANQAQEQEMVKAGFRKANYRGTYIGATGVGKTKIGVDLIVENIRQNPGEQWMIVVPTENLRDNEWINEFNKWGYSQYLFNVKIVCIQTAYRYAGLTLNAVVDEVHVSVSQEYKAFFEKNNIRKLMCFTATIDDPNKRDYIFKMAPLVHTTSLSRARALGIVAPYFVFNLGLNFETSSANRYGKINDMYERKEKELGGPSRAFSNAAMIIKSVKDVPEGERTEWQRDAYSNARSYWWAMQKRKQFLYDCPEKIKTTYEILSMFPDRKSLVFSESIAFATEIRQVSPETVGIYHSKLSKSARATILDQFASDPKMRIISAVKALNAGLNVPDCSLAICASGNSKWLDFIQRQGRIARKMEDKTAIFVNLYMLTSQETRWVYARTKTVDQKYVKWITQVSEIQVSAT